MKPDIHPNYRPVVFHDLASGFSFLTRSTISAKEKITWEDGKEYPLVKVEISSKSHPFFTGQQQNVSTAKQVDKFNKRFGRG
ncbi:MAG: type B 50S ribosomal protein L31 [Pseudomonadota bacterium]